MYRYLSKQKSPNTVMVRQSDSSKTLRMLSIRCFKLVPPFLFFVCVDNGSVKVPKVANELTIFDVSLLYHPLNNTKWQPYIKGGVGFGQHKVAYTYGYWHEEFSTSVVTVPIGLGMRYWCNERFAIHADLTNNMAVASDLISETHQTQHNIALTLGITWAFGGR